MYDTTDKFGKKKIKKCNILVMSIEQTIKNYEQMITEIYESLEKMGLFGNNSIKINPNRILRDMFLINDLCHKTYLILKKNNTEKEKIKLLMKLKGPYGKPVIKSTTIAKDIINNKGPPFVKFCDKLYSLREKKQLEIKTAKLQYVQNGGSATIKSAKKAKATMNEIESDIKQRYENELRNLTDTVNGKDLTEFMTKSNNFFSSNEDRFVENSEKYIPWVFPLMVAENNPIYGWMVTPPLDFITILLNVANLGLKIAWPWINKFISTAATAGTSALSEAIPIVGPLLTGSLYTIIAEPVLERLGSNLVQIILLFIFWSRGPFYFDRIYSIILSIIPELIELSNILTDYLKPMRKYLNIIKPIVDEISLVMKCGPNILGSIMKDPSIFFPNSDGEIDSDAIVTIIKTNKDCLPIPEDILDDSEALTQAISENLKKTMKCIRNLNTENPNAECLTTLINNIIESARQKLSDK